MFRSIIIAALIAGPAMLACTAHETPNVSPAAQMIETSALASGGAIILFVDCAAGESPVAVSCDRDGTGHWTEGTTSIANYNRPGCLVVPPSDRGVMVTARAWCSATDGGAVLPAVSP